MSRQLNYKHLRYFFTIAREGSIVKAAESLHVSPQTISGQLTAFENYLGIELFDRVGKRLILNDAGKLALGYAEDIFSLGEELQQSLAGGELNQKFLFSVGIADVIPKILASGLLESALALDGSVKLVCREGEFNMLLGELALNRLDLVIADRPLSPGTPIKAYSHFMGESGMSFYAMKGSAKKLKKDFPYSLNQHPLLMPGDKSNQKNSLISWFEQQNISPNIIAEFDDSALTKYFGQAGHGVFATASLIEEHVVRQYDVEVIGSTDEIKERFYAISPERKVKHPCVRMLVESAAALFDRLNHPSPSK